MPTLPRPVQQPARPLAELLPLLGDATVLGGADALAVTGVTHDSREVCAGDLYAALPGDHVHGADFVPQAAAAGAVAVLTDRPGPHALPSVVVESPRSVLGRTASWVYGDPSRELQVIGTTGTNGKTTTSYLIEAGFSATGRATGLMGTVEMHAAGAVLPSPHTTPEATDVHALLAVMLERGVSGVAMEVSSHGLALGRVDGVRFAAAVFTNLSQDHLDFHHDMESYFKAKALLFDPARSDVAVINVDDPYGQRLLHRTRCPVVTTSARGAVHADWRAADIKPAAASTYFRLIGPGIEREVRLRLLGEYNVDNALSAVAALTSLGVDADEALGGMQDLDRVPGRLERVDAGQPWLAVVDYAHTPDAVAAALHTVRPLVGGRVIVVLGCGGDRDRGKRPAMGRAAADAADMVVATSDNPRSEDPLAIIEAMVAGARERQGVDVHVEPDRAAAIALACASAGPDDAVVVAGKGHEQGQEFADHVLPFDDRLVLRRSIEQVLA